MQVENRFWMVTHDSCFKKRLPVCCWRLRSRVGVEHEFCGWGTVSSTPTSRIIRLYSHLLKSLSEAKVSKWDTRGGVCDVSFTANLSLITHSTCGNSLTEEKLKKWKKSWGDVMESQLLGADWFKHVDKKRRSSNPTARLCVHISSRVRSWRQYLALAIQRLLNYTLWLYESEQRSSINYH